MDKHIIFNVWVIITVAFLIWIFASYIDVVDGNLTPGNIIHAWNIFKLF